MQELVERALKLAAAGPFTAPLLAEKLGIGLGEAEALVGALLAHGYVREVKPSDCASCFLRGVCGVRLTRGVRVYELTGKGLQLIGGRASPSAHRQQP